MATTTAEQTDLVPQTDLVKPVAPDIQPPGTPNSAKKKRKPRATLTPQHMSTLIASYRLHYAMYSQSRESVTQLVPSSVWKKVYSDFIGLYPEATSFDNEHLKARVRNALKDLESTGNIAEMVQQNEQILKRLKMTGASPLMQQILWRNHNAEISQQRPLVSAVPVHPPSSRDQSPSPPPFEQQPSESTGSASEVVTSDPSVSNESQAAQISQPSSALPSQIQPMSSKSDTDDSAIPNDPDISPRPETLPTAAALTCENSQEPLAAKPAASASRPLPSTPAMGKKALMQTQTTALCKMSMDFNKACAGIMEFLEIHKAKAKQEENKVMLANYEKACEMGVITFEEMKSKARKLLDM